MIHSRNVVSLIAAAVIVAGFGLNTWRISHMNRQVADLKTEVAHLGLERARLESELQGHTKVAETSNREQDKMIQTAQDRVDDLKNNVMALVKLKKEEDGTHQQLLAATTKSQEMMNQTIASLGTCLDAIQRTDKVVLATVTAMEQLVGDEATTRITVEAMEKSREQLKQADKALRETLPTRTK